MRILHLCLANYYIDGYNYQENMLAKRNKYDGHEVLVIASTETFVDNVKLGYVQPRDYFNVEGIHVIRLPYRNFGNKLVTKKLRYYLGLYETICNFQPEVIMAHALSFGSVGEVVKYVKEHPHVRFYADTHTSAVNSGRSWLSLNILHKIIYRKWILDAIPYVKKYFYIGLGERDFSHQVYGVPINVMEFYPLGGVIPSKVVATANRNAVHMELHLRNDELLFVHSGKMNSHKKTVELLRAFTSVPSLKAKLVVIGSLAADIEKAVNNLVYKDSRIQFLGWRTGDELIKYLCACDLYLQPGTGSVTLQNAICCGCPVMAYPYNSYCEDYDFGQFLWVETEDDIKNVFVKLANGETNLEVLADNAMKCATELLDYKKLAARIYY